LLIPFSASPGLASDPRGGDQHAEHLHRRKLFAEKKIGHQRGDRRHEIEQRRDAGDSSPPDEDEEEADGPDRQRHDRPGQSDEEFRHRVEAAALEQERDGSRGEPRTDELRDCVGAQIDRRRGALLPDRAERDGDGAEKTDGKRQRRKAVHGPELRHDHEGGAEKADRDPEPAAGRYALTEKRPDEQPRHEGLQPCDQGRDAGRQAVLDRPEHRPEIAAVDQDAGDHAVAPGPCRCRPRRSRRERDEREDRRRERVAQDKEGQRVRVRHHQPRGDEARRPEEDEEWRGEAHQDRRPGHKRTNHGARRGATAWLMCLAPVGRMRHLSRRGSPEDLLRGRDDRLESLPPA
jgi:hypothetical protein